MCAYWETYVQGLCNDCCCAELSVCALRWYYLQGNFLYCYPNDKAGSKVKGVLYVEGANVCRHSDINWDSKGYFGIAIHTR